MKQTKNFNIVVPELGDKPDITQVSDAIQSLEDALAGTLEVMNATLNGTALTLVSGARTTKRTKYYDGMSIRFIAPSQIAQNTLTSVKVDDLSVQTIEIPYFVNSGDSVDIVYKGNKFIGAITAVQRSNDINSTSTTTVATSNAVKQLNDNKAEKSIQIIAGSGLTGGGNLTSNKTINIVSADEGIIVNSDNIKLNTINAVNNTNAIRPASANAAKTAYDKGVEALAKGNEALTHSQNVNNAKVSKSGDVMTGSLTAPYFTMSSARGLLSSQLTVTDKQVIAADNENRVYLGNPEINKLHLEVNSATSACVTINSTPYTIYHQGFKPSKSDVGLGNVNNWAATTAVNDPSTTKYATASAVKNANDNANGRVSKSGDTMTGHLRSPEFIMTNVQGLRSDVFTVSNKQVMAANADNQVFVGNPSVASVNIEASTNTGVLATIAGQATYPIYHGGNKPTKADVGLDQVQNYPITNSVTDASGVKYASANAVKQAYDKGESALQNAMTAQTNANGRVSKSGDTMTGSLTAPKIILTSNNGIDSNMFTISNKQVIAADNNNSVFVGNPQAGKIILETAENTAYIRVGGYLSNEHGIYHTGNKPSKDDVGLGYVGNYSAVNKHGDTMSGTLISSIVAILNSTQLTSATKQVIAASNRNVYFGNPEVGEVGILDGTLTFKIGTSQTNVVLGMRYTDSVLRHRGEGNNNTVDEFGSGILVTAATYGEGSNQCSQRTRQIQIQNGRPGVWSTVGY